MRSYTCLALGFIAAVAVGACSSAEDTSPSAPPPYSGPVPPGQAAPAPPDGTQVNTPQGPAPVDPAAPPATSNEGGPDVSQLDPSTPPADTSGEGTEPEGTAPEEPPPVTEPTEPTEPEQPPAPAARTRAFLLFGQSNMFGLPTPQQEDLVINPRVEVLTFQACGRHGVNQWMPAQPPLHGCIGQPSGSVYGPGVGPGDYFARAIADAFPDDTILLVPNGIAGVSIDVFQPGQQAYNQLLSRARMAQERGEISGMIFHQGESDCGAQGRGTWPGRVKNVVDRLRSDLGIGEAPFVAGEIIHVYDCAPEMNPVIRGLPNTISNAAVVTADDNFGAVQGDDFNNIHFNLAAQREMGRRYGTAMLGLLQP